MDCYRYRKFCGCIVTAALLGAIVLAVTPYSYSDGVTIITHGYNPSIASSPLWMASLRDDIAENFTGDEQLYGTITVTGTTNALTATCSPWSYDLSSASNAEVMIVVDWSAVADHLTKYVTAQSVASAVVARIVASQNDRPALAELPIHLIGHSRGGGMVCEIARQLGEQGIVVDQVTPLDPHPLTTSDTQPLDPPFGPGAIIDTPAAIYQNVTFADVYYQTASNPVGEYLAGAYNRHWDTALAGGYHNNGSPTNIYPDHRNILLLYQGTVNPADPLSNDEASMGATERAAWFNAYEASGTNTGFIYSRLNGVGDRTSTNIPVAGDDEIRAGLNDDTAFGGGGARSNLTWGAAVWPNIAALDVLSNGVALGSGVHQIAIGTTQQVRYVYLDYDSGCTVTLRLDADRNPYNSNDVAVISTQVFASATGASYTEYTVDWDTAGVVEGTMGYVCATVTDGTHTRYFCAAPQLLLGGSHPPVAGFGTALQLDALASNYVYIADDDALDLTNSHTIEVWFKADSLGGLRGLISKYQTSAANGWYLRLNGTEAQFDGLSTSNLNVQSNTWYHLAGVKDGTNATLYVNGVAVPLTGTFRSQTNANPVRIGSDYSGRYFPGCIDDVRVWDTPLSATVISNWMYREVDPTHPAATNLVAYYKLNDTVGTNVADSTGAHDGTLQNMTGSEWTDSTAGRLYTVTAGQSANRFLPGSDVDGSSSDGADWTLTFEILDPGTYGTATVVSANVFTYSVPLMADTMDTFTYRVRDPSSEVSNISTVTVVVASPRPYVDITNTDEVVLESITAITIGGTNNEWVIGTMWWTNNLTGDYGTFEAASSWSVPDIALACGRNTITVFGTNFAGIATSDSVTIMRPQTHYVWTNSPSPTSPYTNWTTAARTIQDAVDVALSNDTVLVTNGVYDAGGAVTPSGVLTSRVCITRALTLQSVNGPASTFIVGAADPATTSNGPAAVRCLYLVTNVVVSGFTLTNGYTSTSGDADFDRSGGGVFVFRSGTLTNCVITGNSAHYCGGGVYGWYGGRLDRCVVSGNRSLYGGGAYCYTYYANDPFNNCLFVHNTAKIYGGGVYVHDCYPCLNNCTIADNIAWSGGGIYGVGGRVRNCIAYYNLPECSDVSSDIPCVDYTCGLGYSGGEGNITDAPQFVDRDAGDYRLRSGSPCVNSGTNGYVTYDTDLDGYPRIVNGTVDMGVYEFQGLLAITNPSGFVEVSATVESYTVQGTNTATITGTLAWTNRATGIGGTVAADGNWQIFDVSLARGDNVILVSGTNAAGVVSLDAVLIWRSPEDLGDSPLHYVWTNSPTPAWPYTNWATAAHTIQEAVETSSTNDTVLVTNGVYDAGGAVTPGYSAMNRVCILRTIVLQSVNGPADTIIVGAGPVGPGAVRCLYLATNAVVSGFTLTNGNTLVVGDYVHNRDGGGILLLQGGTISNCLITGCSCDSEGGGAYMLAGGEFTLCTFHGNTAVINGGGAYFADGGALDRCIFTGNAAGAGGGVYCWGGVTMDNCLVSGNSAENEGSGQGGGVWNDSLSIFNNCTIVDNTADDQCGGLYMQDNDPVVNCIVIGNSASRDSNHRYGSYSFSCTTPAMSGTGNITNDPQFVNAAAGDYHLWTNSPCINTGTNKDWMTGATDVDGRPRIIAEIADMGAYEYPLPTVDITNVNESLSAYAATYTLGGTNNEYVVGIMTWTNALTGSGGTFAPSLSWTVPDISLAFGTNVITVSGTNEDGVAATDSVIVTRRIDAGDGSPFHYVWTNSPVETWPYTNWATAAHTIQQALDAAWSNDTVLVTNGVYDSGGTVLHGQNFTNRIAITKNVVVQGVNGPTNTFIVGASDNGTNGPLAVRCVWISEGLLTGFTITNGHTQTAGDWTYYQRGGGVFLDHGGTVSNCVISGNSANITGGGVDFQYGGLVVDCRIEGNMTTLNYGGAGASLHTGALLDRCIVRGNTAAGTGGDGGGLYFYSGGIARNCLIAGNTANDAGGGLYVRSTATNALVESCTVVSNAAAQGGGAYQHWGTNINSIIYGNTATSGSNNWQVGSGTVVFDHCDADPLPAGSGCISDNPLFAGNCRLQAASPCINAGMNQSWMTGSYDLDGRMRIMGAAVDIGCFERIVEDEGMSPQHYVSPSGGDAWPYTNWATAARAIQDAVDTAAGSDTVWVADGLYDAGGAVAAGYALSNRVCVTKCITLQSVNGPEGAFIAGASDSGTNGPAAVRCLYVEASAAVSGFTLTNGHTFFSGDYEDMGGGGAYLADGSISNCVIEGNSAAYDGGGLWGGSLTSLVTHCVFRGNTAANRGGGIYLYNGSFADCLIVGNTSADSGGGVYLDYGDMYNCTIADNQSNNGGGIGGQQEKGAVYNSIISGNTSTGGGDEISAKAGDMRYSCSPSLFYELGCITNDPQFADAAAGDYHLQAISPCIDAGTNLADVVDDLDGVLRPLDGNADGTNTVDMGCYEYVSAIADTDSDGLSDSNEVYVTGTSPVNSNTDGDRASDYEEMIADTDGTNSNSYFHVTSITHDSPVSVYFDSSAGRVYAMQGATNLVEGAWTNVPGAGPRAGVGAADSMTDTNEPPAGPFYRMKVQLP